jgi:hypothetical protein
MDVRASMSRSRNPIDGDDGGETFLTISCMLTTPILDNARAVHHSERNITSERSEQYRSSKGMTKRSKRPVKMMEKAR